MTQEISSLWWRSASNSAVASTAAELFVPGAFDLVDEQYILGWRCSNCGKPVVFRWPIQATEVVKHLQVPSTAHHSLAELQQLATMSEQFELVEQPDLSYIMDQQTQLSPSLILVECMSCCTNYLISYAVGIGDERRSKLPTLGFRGIWRVG